MRASSPPTHTGRSGRSLSDCRMNKKVSASYPAISSLPSPPAPPRLLPGPMTHSAESQPTPCRWKSPPCPRAPTYKPGELVDYTAQSGDTLPALAARFNTSVDEIRAANPFIPEDATTMPPGMPMKIPIYYLALWASPYQIIPDHAFVNSPTAIGFNTAAFVASQAGWLKNYREYAGGEWRSGAGIVDYVATNFSLNPRLLLAILEYQAQALSDPDSPESPYVLGLQRPCTRQRLPAIGLGCQYIEQRLLWLAHREPDNLRPRWMEPNTVPTRGRTPLRLDCNITSRKSMGGNRLSRRGRTDGTGAPYTRTLRRSVAGLISPSSPAVSASPNCPCPSSRVRPGRIPAVRTPAGERANHLQPLTLRLPPKVRAVSPPRPNSIPSPWATA